MDQFSNQIPLQDESIQIIGIEDVLQLIPEYSSKNMAEYLNFREGCLKALYLLSLKLEKPLLKLIKLKLKGIAYLNFSQHVDEFSDIQNFLNYVECHSLEKLFLNDQNDYCAHKDESTGSLNRHVKENECTLASVNADQSSQGNHRSKHDNQIKVQKKYIKIREKSMDRYVDYDKQKHLEMRHREEEDKLYREYSLRKKNLLEEARVKMAKLAEKQSLEMLEFINRTRENFMKKESLYLEENSEPPNSYPVTAPLPQPLVLLKTHLFEDPHELAKVDKLAQDVAQENQNSFTELVRQLVSKCESDVEKARAIFQWITTKDLNVMQFDENLQDDSPMGLLHGIKIGIETYHFLFQRLCSYAGLHCKVIVGYCKGYTKSNGNYLPGMRFESNSRIGSCNVVYVADSWRFVNCNWGARSITDMKSGNVTYEYNDHYFLTDPQEFIYEFFPLQEEWQLLEQLITLKDFEELPKVSSEFFKYGMRFKTAKAVMETSTSGYTKVDIQIPKDVESTLFFEYYLQIYNSNIDTYNGTSLNRFIMLTTFDEIVQLFVRAPCTGSFLLTVYAKKGLTPIETMPFKGICALKIVCKELQVETEPWPDCNNDEWGPDKATRLFGLVPISHHLPTMITDSELKIRFYMSRPLTDFEAILRNNDFEEEQLCKYVSHEATDDLVTFSISFPKYGKYGLDIYTCESSECSHTEHCCQYFINYYSATSEE